MSFVSLCVGLCLLIVRKVDATTQESSTDTPQSLYIATSDDYRSRLVSTSSTCSSGRLEIYSPSKDEWASFSDCSYVFDSDDAETFCETMGFSGSVSYYRGSTSYTNVGYDSIPSKPYYCGYDYVYCSSDDDDFCKDCDLDWNSYCDDRSSSCHKYDIYVVCSGGSASNCESYDSIDDFDESNSKSCKGSNWKKQIAKALSSVIIVVIVLSIVCFIVIIIGIVCCVSGTVACCACCCRKNHGSSYGNQHYTQMHTNTHIVQQPVQTTHVQPIHQQQYIQPQVNFNNASAPPF